MPGQRLADYIKVYDGVLPPEHCRALIERFEGAAERTARQVEGGYSFVQLDVTKNWPDEYRILQPLLLSIFGNYQADLKVGRCWPARFYWEHLRLKRYLPNGRDSFPLHVDAYDTAAASRFVTALIYLNDVTGGETVFPDLELSVSPAEGRAVVFPPLWNFPHAGLPPKSAAKYILHAYLLYPPPGG